MCYFLQFISKSGCCLAVPPPSTESPVTFIAGWPWPFESAPVLFFFSFRLTTASQHFVFHISRCFKFEYPLKQCQQLYFTRETGKCVSSLSCYKFFSIVFSPGQNYGSKVKFCLTYVWSWIHTWHHKRERDRFLRLHWNRKGSGLFGFLSLWF